MAQNYYEQTYIISPVLEDDDYKEVIKKYGDIILNNGGSIDEMDEWGIQSFAYEIDGKSSGYYVNIYFEAPGDVIEKMERAQRIDDNIMRSLTLKYDAKMLRHRALQKKNAVPQLVDADEEEDDDNDDD